MFRLFVGFRVSGVRLIVSLVGCAVGFKNKVKFPGWWVQVFLGLVLRFACCDLSLFGVQQCFHARLCLELVHRAAPVQVNTCKHVNTSNSLLLNIFSPEHSIAKHSFQPWPTLPRALLQKPCCIAHCAASQKIC